MQQPIVQSHRGAGALAPENTLPSFLASWRMGAWPEADLRTTRDGTIVAFHDANFSRVVENISPELRDKAVQDVDFRDIETFDVGQGQRICRVEEIFDSLRGDKKRGLYLDIKNVDLLQLAALAREFGVTKQVVLASPKEAVLREWMGLVPEAQTLLWMGIRRTGDENTLRTRLDGLRDEGFAGIAQLQIHVEATRNGDSWEFKPSLDFLREVATDLKAHGVLFQTLPWDCDEIEVYRALVGAGAESFASDYPAVALEVLRENTKSQGPL